jgi:hypothetical protein
MGYLGKVLKMKILAKAILIAGLVSLTPAMVATASADGIGVHVGPIGVGVGIHGHRHHYCEYHHHHRFCGWR